MWKDILKSESLIFYIFIHVCINVYMFVGVYLHMKIYIIYFLFKIWDTSNTLPAKYKVWILYAKTLILELISHG